MGGIFDTLGHTGDYHNILTITGWSPTRFLRYQPDLLVGGSFPPCFTLPPAGTGTGEPKISLVLPIGMLLFTVLGLPVAYYLVPGSPIDLQYHLAHEIILSAYYRPLFMGSIGILLALIYTTLYRSVYRRIPAGYERKLIACPGEIFGIRVCCSSSV